MTASQVNGMPGSFPPPPPPTGQPAGQSIGQSMQGVPSGIPSASQNNYPSMYGNHHDASFGFNPAGSNQNLSFDYSSTSNVSHY